MKRNVKELKRIARSNLQGNYIEMIRAFIVCNIIVSLLQFPFAMMQDDRLLSTSNIIYYVAAILIGIASVVLTAGQSRMHLKLARTGKPHPEELFTPLKQHSDRFIFTEFLVSVIFLIGLLPFAGAVILLLLFEGIAYYVAAGIFILIGIVLTVFITLNLDLIYFVMNDHENLSMITAVAYTRQLINGHKKQYFYLLASFLGMAILGLFSFGLGFIWIQPYKQQTCALFYLDIAGELDTILNERKKGPSPEPTVINHYA